jgi:hypothetical protein
VKRRNRTQSRQILPHRLADAGIATLQIPLEELLLTLVKAVM